VVIFALSVAPVGWILGFAGDEGGSWLEGLGHFLEFGVFTALVAVGWSRRRGWPEAVALGAAAGIGYGLLIEAVQYPLPYRSAQAIDFVLDVCGVAAAVLLLIWARRRRERRTGRRG
jgi:VanZ family protein